MGILASQLLRHCATASGRAGTWGELSLETPRTRNAVNLWRLSDQPRRGSKRAGRPTQPPAALSLLRRHLLHQTNSHAHARAAMICAVLFVNQKGEVIISRHYRDGFDRNIADLFRAQVITSKEV